MKKIILILFGISIILTGIIFVLYKNNESKNEEIVDIFKDEEVMEDNTETFEEENTSIKENNKVVVDIKGMVASPGVYEVDSSARVNDVINLAGGLIEGSDTSMINLAKIVSDEMTIIIYSSEEVLQKYKDKLCICDCPEITNDACINNDNKNENIINKQVDINKATKEELMTITGIGETKADAIIKYREENGNFKSVEDIQNVPGIGEFLFESIKDYITV